jgi:hypothetical protein
MRSSRLPRLPKRGKSNRKSPLRRRLSSRLYRKFDRYAGRVRPLNYRPKNSLQRRSLPLRVPDQRAADAVAAAGVDVAVAVASRRLLKLLLPPP